MTGSVAPAQKPDLPPWDEGERLAALRAYAILDTPPERSFDDLCRIAAEICRTPIAVVNLVEDGRQFFKAEIGLGVRETPLDVSICAHAILQRDLFVVPDTLKDPRFACNPLVTGAPHLRFYAGALIETPEGLPLGTVCVLDHAPRPEGLTEAQAHTLEALARQVMTLLEHRQALVSLARREAELARVQRIAGVGGLEVDLREGFKNLRSPEYLAVHGLGPESAQESHQDWVRRIHPDDRTRVEGDFLAAVRGDAQDYHALYRIVTPAGELRWVEAFAEIERDEAGRAQRLVGAHINVTARKRAEFALEESERRFRVLADAMPQMVWSTLPDGYHDYYNRRWYEFTGTPPGSTDGEGWNGVFHPDDQERAWAAWRHSLATGEPYEIEYRLRHHTGTYRWTLGRALPVLDAEGRIARWFGTCTDIHDQKLAEEALRAADERLQIALDAGRVGTWVWDIPRGVITGDARLARMFGVDPAEVARGAPLDRFTACIHPEERERIEAVMAEVVTRGGEHEVEHRIIQGGQVRWIAARGRCDLDANGRPVRFAAATVDITERKRAEAELAARTVQLETLLATAPVAVWFTDDPQVHRVMRNGHAAALMGVSPGDTSSLGGGDGSLQHVEMRYRGGIAEPRQLPLQRAMAGEDVRDEEYELVFRDGRPTVTLLSSASPLRDGGGAVTGAVAVSLDITNRKRVEEARELLARELSHRIKNIFTVVGGLVTLSSRGHPEAAEFAEGLRERLHALAQAHEYVRPHSPESAPQDTAQTLQGLVALLLAPYVQAGEDRLAITGSDVAIGSKSATALALVLHEQATNAVKYGALSRDGGCIALHGEEAEGVYRLTWRETGGPAVFGEPTKRGFGTLLAARSVAGQLGGTLTHDWAPEGLTMHLSVPVAHLQR